MSSQAQKMVPTGGKIVDDERLVNYVRLIKSEAEIQKIREAAQIMDKVIAKAVETVTAETRGCDLAAAIMHQQVSGTKEFGGTFTAIAPILASGTDSDAGHLQWSSEPYVKRDADGNLPQSVVGEGAAIAMELAASRDHYHCPMARTVMVGTPSAEYKRFIQCCYEAMDDMLALARPGNTCEQMYWAYQNKLLEGGFTKKSRVGYSCGIGFAPDWGEKTISVRPGDKTVLEPGMCLHLIAGCGDGYLFETSEVIVIREGEPEKLHGAPRELFVKAIDAEKAKATPTLTFVEAIDGGQVAGGTSPDCVTGLLEMMTEKNVAALETESGAFSKATRRVESTGSMVSMESTSTMGDSRGLFALEQ